MTVTVLSCSATVILHRGILPNGNSQERTIYGKF